MQSSGLDGRIQTAAITYDPEFDLPTRLRAYGENRGVVFSPSDHLLRTKGALAPLEDYFVLGVSFSGTLVNRHRIELFLLDREARVAGAFTRLQWDVEEVLAQATSLTEPGSAAASRTLAALKATAETQHRDGVGR